MGTNRHSSAAESRRHVLDLETFEVPYRTLLPAAEGGTAASHEAALDWARETLDASSRPCALLVRKDAL